MAIVILGSPSSLHSEQLFLKSSDPNQIYTDQDGYQKKKEGTIMIDRKLTTRDRDRECGSSYSRSFDARYMKCMPNRFKPGYSCNQHYCPMIKERLARHQHECHTPGPATAPQLLAPASRQNSTMTTTPSTIRCVKTKSGPDANGDSLLPYVSNNSMTTGNPHLHKNQSKVTKDTSTSNNSINTQADKFATTDKTINSGNYIPYINTDRDTSNRSKAETENNINKQSINNSVPIIPFKFYNSQHATIRSNDCNKTSTRESEKSNGKRKHSDINKPCNPKSDNRVLLLQNHKYEPSAPRGNSVEMFAQTDVNKGNQETEYSAIGKEQIKTSSKNANIKTSDMTSVETSKSKNIVNMLSDINNTVTKIPFNFCNSKYNKTNNRQSSSKEFAEMEEATWFPETEHLDIGEAKSNFLDNNYSHISVNRKINKSFTSKSNKSISPNFNGIKEVTKSLRNINKDPYPCPIQREVIEWIRHIPMYPGLGKETKEDNKNAFKNLIINLRNLLSDSDDTEYEHKVKIEICTCLNKIPIWYPDARKQGGFKCYLINHLFQRIVSINRNKNKVNVEITSNRTSSATVTETNHSKLPNEDNIKKVIMEWLWSIDLKIKNNNGMTNKMSQIVDFIITRIGPLLHNQKGNKHKAVLRTAIVNAMNGLPIKTNFSKKRSLCMNILAEDLASILLSDQTKYNNYYGNYKNVPTILTNWNKNCESANSEDILMKSVICCTIRKCFKDASINCSNVVMEDAGRILLNFYEKLNPEAEDETRSEIVNLLVTCTNISEAEAINITDSVMRNIGNTINESNICKQSQQKFQKPNAISVYTSIDEYSPLNYPLTSTPKREIVNKIIPKLNPQEVQYMESVANLIRAWMDTLPASFNTPEEYNFKETMIYDLAGDIMDKIKLEQLAPGTEKDSRKYLKYFVSRWIFRLGVFEILEVEPQIENFLNKLEEIQVPIMTQPQHGNRQAMENLKHNVGERRNEPFLVKGADVLEDEISMWMNEQPSYIFTNNNRISRNKKIHELAEVLGNKLKNKLPQSEISKDVTQWLENMVKPEEKREIPVLTKNLKDRVIDLPQDATLAAKFDIKLKEKAEYLKELDEYLKARNIDPTKSKTINNDVRKESIDQENTMKMFISNFIEHNYDTDDPLARRAYNQVLRTYLQRLNPSNREEVYDNFNKGNDNFPSPKLIKELEYIKDISDWLKNLPIDASYNTLGNRERIEFVNNLAINIREVEEERDNNPNAMDYTLYMATIIDEFMVLLPIPREYTRTTNMHFMISQLIDKIVAHRENIADRTKANESINTTGVHIENIGDFIEEFIRINGNDVAQDEVKLEAWAIRLIREIKTIVRNTGNSSVLSKGNIYNKLTGVPIPGDETAKYFTLELEYIKEISNWLKNLPLLPLSASEEDGRIQKICDLAEKICELERKNCIFSSDKEVNKDFNEYLVKWISDLPLDKRQKIVQPVIIQQLVNRIQKVKDKDTLSGVDSYKLNKTAEEAPIEVNRRSLSKSRRLSKDLKNSKNLVIDVIEKWSNALPVKAENENATAKLKNDVSRKLFQKIGQLNMDPIIFNDNLLYEDMLVDEVDTIFENLPQNSDLQNNGNKLKSEIINAIIEAKNSIQEKMAGGAYQLKLKNTIEASIPNPVSIKQMYDPGFEIYKDRLATMFILENFDHGADAIKMKYENLLKTQIDKYFEHAKNKNAIPISKDEIYNELYSALYKVPIPNEASIIEEIEEVKTRCEIDAWFEELPIKQSDDLCELLERDKILSTLAKRIHEIETSETKSDEKIFKEIMKWLVRLPLQSGNENNFEKFAKNLQTTLKSTKDQRKCVLNNLKTSKVKKNKAKAKVLGKKSKEDSQIAGPSSSGKQWVSISEPQQMPKPRSPKKKAADEIIEIVQTWCNQLPISAKTPSEQERAKMLKDTITTKIIIKISEFNGNPEIFNNDVGYDELLDNELEKLLSGLPTTRDFINSKAARKHQLKEAIKSIKPLIKEEIANHRYIQNLNKTVDKILDKPQKTSPQDEALLFELRNDIIDDFILLKFNKDDDEVRQNCKKNLQDTVSKFIVNGNDKNEKSKISLMKTNQLICELDKTAVYKTNFQDEVDEIRMKKEVGDFFGELHLLSKDADNAKANFLKAMLAKKLNEIEMNGHTPENEEKMKLEIEKCLKKLGKEVNPKVVNAFVAQLKNDEMARRAPAMATKLGACQEDCKRTCLCCIGKLKSGISSINASPKLTNIKPDNFDNTLPLTSANMPQTQKQYQQNSDKNTDMNLSESKPQTQEQYQQNSDKNTDMNLSESKPQTQEQYQQNSNKNTETNLSESKPQTQEQYQQNSDKNTDTDFSDNKPQTQEQYQQNNDKNTDTNLLESKPQMQEQYQQNGDNNTDTDFSENKPQTQEQYQQNSDKNTGTDFSDNKPQTQEQYQQNSDKNTDTNLSEDTPQMQEQYQQNNDKNTESDPSENVQNEAEVEDNDNFGGLNPICRVPGAFCARKNLKSCGCKPFFMIPMRQICEDCSGCSPFWCRMPLPGFLQ